MTPTYDTNGVTIYQGDAWTLASQLEPQSVNCIVTSPPYWGLRDYGTPGQFGLEPTPGEYVAKLVDLFERLKPALRDDGTVWLNLGDSYATTPTGNRGTKSNLNGANGDAYSATLDRYTEAKLTRAAIPDGLKPKDLIGVPWRVAFALQEAGWYLRSDIIWAKNNPMPESVTDRPTKAHEYIFLLSKRPRYYYDAAAIAEPCSETCHTWNTKEPGEKNATRAGEFQVKPQVWRGYKPETRNARSVWTVPTEAFPEAHFATYPRDLIRPCIRAGCPAGGVVLDPFLGSGTTAQVCREEGRRCVGFELNPEYIDIARKHRLAQTSLLVETFGS